MIPTGQDTQPRPASFFGLTFLLSWAVWVPLMLIRLDVLPRAVPLAALTPVALLGVLMPSVAATLLTARVGGRVQVQALWRRLLLWRVGRWWLVVALVQPGVLVVTALVHNGVGRGDPVRLDPGLTVGALVASLVFLLIASTGEEVGWRGVALPGLLARTDPLRTSVVLGLVVATWHVPYWVLLGVLGEFGPAYLAIDYVFVVALTFQLTWLFNNTGGSILVAVAFHLVFNTVNVALLPVTASTGAYAVLTALECALALALISQLRRRVSPS